jgi:HEPN domain-containing protein
MNVIDIVTEWFRFADNDLLVARHCFENMYPKQTEISCYHCQQCAEKALKGYLIYKGTDEPPKIHNLYILCNLCNDYDDSFFHILDICADLTNFCSVVRYPDEFAPDEYIAEQAIKKAQKIYDFCKTKIT